jgi:type I restriction enzyme M protein
MFMSSSSSSSNNIQNEIKNAIWKSLDSLRGSFDVSEYKNYILIILFIKFISDLKRDYGESFFVIPKGNSFGELCEKIDRHNLGDIVNRAAAEIEHANPEKLGGILSSVDFHATLRVGTREDLNDALRHFMLYLNLYVDLSVARTNNTHLAGDLFSYLIGLFAHVEGHRSGESYTPQHLLPLLVKLLQPKSGKSLYDPVVGTAGILIAAHQYIGEYSTEAKKELELVGQDISTESVALAKMNLYFHRIFDAKILQGDTLRQPRHLDGEKLRRFDYILANPPFGTKARPEIADELMHDRYNRFSFGTPARSGEYLFLQHIVASLNESGKAIVIVPSSVLFVSGTDGEIRKRIIEKDLIEAVISLGPGLLASTGIPINLLIINKAKPVERKYSILLINATEEYERINRAGSFVNPEQQAKIVNAYNSFSTTGVFAKVVSLDELGQNEFNLLPTRYVQLFPINNFLGGKVTWERIENIADVLQSSALARSPEIEGDVPVIRISDLSNRRSSVDDLQRVSLVEQRDRVQYVQTGDILLSRVGTIKTFLVEESLNGAAIDRNLYIIRLKPEYQHHKRYIVELLQSDKGYNLLSRYLMGAGMPQLRLTDLLKIEIPIPDDSVIQLITSIHQVENELIQRIEKAQELRTKLFNITDPGEVQKQLNELGTDTQILSSSLVQADSLDYQIRNFYPYPLAFPYRSLSANYDPVLKYPHQLRVAENLLVFLAAIGLTIAQINDGLKAQSEITATSIQDYFQGGISPGDWQSLAYASAKVVRGQRRYAIGESFAALWFKGSGTKISEFTNHTKTLVKLKNDYKHDRGPKTPQDYAISSEDIQGILDSCYAQLGFLVKYPIRLVQSMDMEYLTNVAILETLVYEGDHPGLRREQVRHPKPLPKDMLYLEINKDLWAPLYPQINVQYCQSCKSPETYFIDLWEGTDGKVTLKSFEHGHTHDSNTDKKQVVTYFGHWLRNNFDN